MGSSPAIGGYQRAAFHLVQQLAGGSRTLSEVLAIRVAPMPASVRRAIEGLTLDYRF